MQSSDYEMGQSKFFVSPNTKQPNNTGIPDKKKEFKIKNSDTCKRLQIKRTMLMLVDEIHQEIE